MPELGDRDFLNCLKYYISLIPSTGPFYRRPASGSSVVFTKQVIGKNALNNLVKKFCEEAGLQGYFTGHSGKVTCATELFSANVDEQLIQIHTGHRSIDAVRCYKRPAHDHFKNTSKILQPPPAKKSTNDESENINPSSLIKSTSKMCTSTEADSESENINPSCLIKSTSKMCTSTEADSVVRSALSSASFNASHGGTFTVNFNFNH